MSRYPFPHRLPIKWLVITDELTEHPVIYASCVLPGGAEYATWHAMPECSQCEIAVMACLVVETLTMEILDVAGSSALQPVGLMAGVQ
jgi:hypothetical protein